MRIFLLCLTVRAIKLLLLIFHFPAKMPAACAKLTQDDLDRKYTFSQEASAKEIQQAMDLWWGNAQQMIARY